MRVELRVPKTCRGGWKKSRRRLEAAAVDRFGPDRGVHDGEIITLRVDFSEKVIIDGTPHVNVDIGGVTRHATLQSDVRSSSGYVDAAIFQYQVQSGDNDDDGIGLFANSFILNDAGIHDSAGIGLGLTHAAIAADPGQRVDTSTDD